MIAKSRAMMTYQGIEPFVLSEQIMTNANAKFMRLCDNTDDDIVSKMVACMQLSDLEALSDGIVEIRLSEQTVHRLACLLVPELAVLNATVESLNKAAKALEHSFVYVFTQSIFDDEYHQYDFKGFAEHVNKILTEKQTLARNGVMDD